MARETYDLIQFKRGKLRDWLDINPVLEYGEPGFVVSDSLEILGLKIGNGIQAFKDLPYAGNPDGGGGTGGFDPDVYYTKDEINAMIDALKSGQGTDIQNLQGQITENAQAIAANEQNIDNLSKDKADLITTYENSATPVTDLLGQGYILGDSVSVNGIPGIVTEVGGNGEITGIWLENTASAAPEGTLRVDGGNGTGASVTITSTEKKYGIEESEAYMTQLTRTYAIQKLDRGPVDGKFRAVRNASLEELYSIQTTVYVDPTYSGQSNGTEFAPYKSISEALTGMGRPTADGIILLSEGNYDEDVNFTGYSNKLLIGKAVLGERKVFLKSLTIGSGSENLGFKDFEILGTTTITGSGAYTFENVKLDGQTTITKGTTRFSRVTSGANLEFTNGNILYENCELSGVTSTIGTGALLETRNSRIGQVNVTSGGSFIHYSGTIQAGNGLPAVVASTGATSVLLLGGTAADANGNLQTVSIASRTTYMLGAFLFNSDGSQVPSETFRKTDGLLAEQIRVGLSAIGYTVTSPFLNAHLQAIGNKILDVQAEGYNVPIVITPDDPLNTTEYTIQTGGNYTEGRVLYGLSVSISGKINASVLGHYEDGYTRWVLPAKDASYFALSSTNQLAGAQISLDESIKAVGSPITGITSAQAAVQIQEAIEKHNSDPSAHTFLLNLISSLSGIAGEKQDKLAAVTGTPKLMVPPTTSGGQPTTVEQSAFLASPEAALGEGTQILTAPTTKGAAPGMKPASSFATSTQGAKADSAVQDVTFAGKKLTKGTGQNATITQADARTALGLNDAAYKPAADFATAAQGAKADSAVQPTTMNQAISDAVTPVSEDVDSIEEKIPSAASKDNQLADKAFVNSSITNMAARFITPTADGSAQWSSLNALRAGPWYFGAQSVTCTENDYAVYLDEDGAQYRASYQNKQWATQYKLNDKPFTSDQQKAIDSGITSEIVADIVPKTRTVNGKALSSNIVLNTDDINEGTKNLYYTDERVEEVISQKTYEDFGAQPAMNAAAEDETPQILIQPTEEGAQPGTIPQTTYLKTVPGQVESVLMAPEDGSNTPTLKPISDFASSQDLNAASQNLQKAVDDEATARGEAISALQENINSELAEKASKTDLTDGLAGKVDKNTSIKTGNLIEAGANGALVDSGEKIEDYAKIDSVSRVQIIGLGMSNGEFTPTTLTASSNLNVTIVPEGNDNQEKYLLPTTFNESQALISCFNLALSGASAPVDKIWLSSAVALNNNIFYNSNFWLSLPNIGTAKFYQSNVRIAETSGAKNSTVTAINSQIEITRDATASGVIIFSDCENSTIHLHGNVVAEFRGSNDGLTIYLHDNVSIGTTEDNSLPGANTFYICGDHTTTNADYLINRISGSPLVINLKDLWSTSNDYGTAQSQHDLAYNFKLRRLPASHTNAVSSMYGGGTGSLYGHVKTTGVDSISVVGTISTDQSYVPSVNSLIKLLKPYVILLPASFGSNSNIVGGISGDSDTTLSQKVSGTTGSYQFSVNNNVHGKGYSPQVKTYSLASGTAGRNGGTWEETYDSPTVNLSDGTVTVFSNANTPALRIEIRV